MAKKTPTKKSGKAKRCLPTSALKTQTEAGVEWLNSLGEAEFRDDILEHLFRKMQKAGALEWYANIHGRNDKGVDFLLVEKTVLARRILGIQVKSKEITRSEGNNASLSSIRIKHECDSAMTHEFDVQGQKGRLDNIAVWTSAHITEDARKEFLAPGGVVRVTITDAKEVFTLIEDHCPEMLKKIPQCALTQYIKGKSESKATSFKLLGCELHPKHNFLEPTFTRSKASSHTRLKVKNAIIRQQPDNVSIDNLIRTERHTIINAPELSGKTYLLEHLQCIIADKGSIPIMLPASSYNDQSINVMHLISKEIGGFTLKEVEELTANINCVLIIDNIDRMRKECRDALLSLDPARIKVLATAKNFVQSGNLEVLFMNGVQPQSIPKFLRSIDTGDNSMVFTDRAHSFINRSLSSSGLPSNPFTISILLAECQISPSKFSTPTLGRLIERFIDLQLGSHSDFTAIVDFETKREFLTKLAGSNQTSLADDEFRRKLGKTIASRSHPHKIEDFFEDLLQSGVFKRSDEGEITWSHPVIKQYFWVRNLVSNRKFDLIIQKLKAGTNLTLAALVGSQLQNAQPVIDPLLESLSHIKIPTVRQVLISAKRTGINLFPTEEQEEALLSDIESGKSKIEQGKKELSEEVADSDIESVTFTQDEKSKFLKQAESIAEELNESKFYLIINLSAILVNSRDTKTDCKINAVKRIIAGNQQLGGLLKRLFDTVLNNEAEYNFFTEWLRIYCQMVYIDGSLGDPFLVNIFRQCLRSAKTDDESVALLDLLLCCGSDEFSSILTKLRQIDRIEVTYAFYTRTIWFYYFRYQRESEKQALRKFMKEMRKIHKSITLPQVA